PPALRARERLDDPGELREEEVEDRPRRELGDAAAARRLQLVAHPQRPLVERLYELDVRPREERAEDAVYELRVMARDVGVHPHDEIAGHHVEALPERLALPAVAAAFWEDLVVDEDRDAFVRRDLARAVLGPRVDDDDLVHERDALDEARPDRVDDPPDRRLLVQRRQADRDTETLALLLLDETAEIRELRRAEGVLREPLVDHLADHLAPLGTILRKPRPGEEHAGRERRPRAHDDRVLRRREHGLAHGTERVLGAFTPGRSEDDRVVIGELVGDDLDGIARARDEALHALVVSALAEELVEGRAAARAVAAGDVEEGHRAVARPRELRADPRRELGIAAASDRDEDAPGPRRRAFDDGEIAGGISQHLLDRETEDVPARP